MPIQEAAEVKDRAMGILDVIDGLIGIAGLDEVPIEDQDMPLGEDSKEVKLDKFGNPIDKGVEGEEDPVALAIRLLKDDLTAMRDNLATLTGKMGTLVGMVNDSNAKVASLSGQVSANSAKLSELAGLAGQVAALSSKIGSMQPTVIHRDLSSGEPPKMNSDGTPS